MKFRLFPIKPLPAACVIAFVLQSPALSASQIAMTPGGSSGKASLPPAAEEQYTRIVSRVQSGALPQKAGADAREIRFSLKKYLSDADAGIEARKNDVRHSRGRAQEEALEKLTAAVAERERVLMKYVGELNAIAGGRKCGNSSSGSRPEETGENETRAAGKKTSNFEIEFRAEDLTSGESALE